jgi:hypothetical protein
MNRPLVEVALTRADTEKILSFSDGEALLVGGQSLAFWALYYHLQPTEILGEHITTDADFIGSQATAKRLNQRLNWTLWLPTPGDATPRSAKLTQRVGPNGVKQIDFLYSIHGLDTSAVQKRGVTVQIETGALIRILHPLDVLESRFRNLQTLPSKQNLVGVAQAKLAIRVVRAFIEELLGSTDNRKRVLQAVERVATLSHDKALLNVLERYALDPLEAIPADRIAVKEFKTKRWPQIVATAQALREKHAAHLARRQADSFSKFTRPVQK